MWAMLADEKNAAMVKNHRRFCSCLSMSGLSLRVMTGFRSFRLGLILLMLLAATTGWATETTPRTLLVEIRHVPVDQRDSRGVEAGTGRYSYDSYNRDRVLSVINDTVTTLANAEELATMRAEGLEATVLMESDDPLALIRRGLYGPTSKLDAIYHTYDQIVAKAEAFASAHPDRIKRFQIGATQQFRRPIYAYRLSNNAKVAQDRPAVMFNGAHHADELVGTEIVVTLMEKLVRDYGTDAEITHWMNTLEIWLVPVVNVDGHDIVTSGHDPRWRKNARDVNGDGITGIYPEGVDPNRGYDFNWASGGSGDPAGVSYRGEYPFSEGENRAMRRLTELRQFVASISYHSQGEIIFYPWTWGGRPAPDDAVIKGLVTAVAARIPKMDGSGTYDISPGGPSSQSYPWLYGRKGVIDFIVEVGKGSHVFPPEVVPGLIATNLDGVRVLMERLAGPGLAVQVQDAGTSEPLAAQVWLPQIENETIDRRHSDAEFGRLWRLLEPGRYTLIVSCEGYVTQRFEQVEVGDGAWTALEVALERE
jgi:hypothetical protein